ncbi:MAG: bile acid:sodium symporter [bacterium]|nr:bile acid:sodium symporter [bacterium]
MYRLSNLLESYIFILIAAIVIGLLIPKQANLFFPFISLILSIIFFLASIKLDLSQFVTEIKNAKIIIFLALFMMLVLPAFVYLVAKLFIPSYAFALLILTAMPVGMTAPLLTEVAGGRVSLALVFVVITSLIAPFSIPFVLKIITGEIVTLNFMDMFLRLAKIIFIPFFLAQIIRYFFHHKIKTSYWTLKPVSIILLGLLIAGVVANQAEVIKINLASFLPAIIIMSIYFLLMPYLMLFLTKKYEIGNRISIAVSVTFTNFTLGIYIAANFFPEPNIIIPTILSVLPWSLAFIPFKYFAKKIV